MGKPRRQRRPFGRLAKSLALLLSIGLALLLGEVVVRALGLAPGVKPIVTDGEETVYRRSTNPRLGFELKANYRDENANLVISYPSTNSHGQRDIERSLEKPAGVRRIILLGDSVVEGESVREIDDLMSRQLERLYPGGGVEVLNFGVSGYCTAAEVELLRVKGLTFQPDVVIVVFVENDFDNFNKQLFELGSYDRPAVVESLFLRSSLFRLACIGLDLFSFRSEIEAASWNREALGDNNVVDGLKRLGELADRHSFQPLIAIWPRFLNDQILDVHFMPGSADELVVERLARASGIPAVRLSAHFEKHRESLPGATNPRLLYTARGDSMHPSEAGCRVAAAALKAVLDDLESGRLAIPAKPAASGGGVADAKAIEAARESATEFDNSGKYNNLGNASYAAGRVEEAIGHYREALRIDPEYASAHHNLGIALVYSGKVDEGARHYLEALRIDPDSAEAHHSLGLVLVSRGKLDEAFEHFDRALEIRPDIADAYFQLAAEAQRRKNVPAAIRYYRQFLKARPDHARAHLLLGLSLNSIGQRNAAVSSFERTLELQPDSPLALRHLAWILATHPDPGQRDPDTAVRWAERASLLMGRRDLPTEDALAAAFAASGEFERAVATLEAALEVGAASGASETLMADIHKRLERYRSGRTAKE